MPDAIELVLEPRPRDLGGVRLRLVAGRALGATSPVEVFSDLFLVLASGARVELAAATDARVMLLGGAPLDGERHLWWNFVSSDPARIERAKADWREGRFPRVPGETGFIPLPED